MCIHFQACRLRLMREYQTRKHNIISNQKTIYSQPKTDVHTAGNRIYLRNFCLPFCFDIFFFFSINTQIISRLADAICKNKCLLTYLLIQYWYKFSFFKDHLPKLDVHFLNLISLNCRITVKFNRNLFFVSD